METKKILAGFVILATVGVTGLTYAATTNSGSTLKNTVKEFNSKFEGRGQMMGGKIGYKKGGCGIENLGMFGIGGDFKNNLTAEEKTKLESMTKEERQAFMETKRTEMQAKMTARENVIDKLLNGETLTDSEKTILEEIKKQRAEMKIRKAQMDEFRNNNKNKSF